MEHNTEVIYDIQGFEDPINGYVTDFTYDAERANSSEEARINFVSKTSAISRAKDESSNPESRYKHLLKEGAMGTASRCLEFVPVYFEFEVYGNRAILHLKDNKQSNMSLDKFMNTIVKFGFIENMDRGMFLCKTNLRAMLKADIPYEDVPYNNVCKGFRVFKMQIPMFVFNHVVTHTMLSKESRSDRVVRLNKGNYWVPEDIVERIRNTDIEERRAVLLESGVKKAYYKLRDTLDATKHYNSFILAMLSIPTADLMGLLEVLKYPREIFQRAVLEMRYKETILAAWEHEFTWLNFLRERGGSEDWKNWVQKETKQAAVTLAKFFK
jgi:hypothetical protein|nr:MAG TPA: hypothetical protein [Caudoviricetes sp.]